jgi:hypothetical protein
VGSALAFTFASRFFLGCPTTALPVSFPKDLDRFRCGSVWSIRPFPGGNS